MNITIRTNNKTLFIMIKSISISMLGVVLCAFVFFAASCNSNKPENTNAQTEQMADAYQCPMDCENGKIYDKPGDCPVCGMPLEAVDASSDAELHDHDHDHDHEEAGSK
jgi:flagellar basal body-associated protein FliL